MSAVISVRVPKKLKEELEKLGINYSIMVREYLEELVRREKARRLKKAMDELRASIKPVNSNLSIKFIREDRETR
ncbi:MAG: type II toxin-antitoxin system CcdA family antitoxin [Desulfurococcales archaeon]|nr:type II toxin-antitoxin system CcdA family antitoxin [Desulfurococcales archaeon]